MSKNLQNLTTFCKNLQNYKKLYHPTYPTPIMELEVATREEIAAELNKRMLLAAEADIKRKIDDINTSYDSGLIEKIAYEERGIGTVEYSAKYIITLK